MDRITKTAEQLEEMDSTVNGELIKELLDKINEIIDWINNR
tara:strand:- start:382 stop:504 length:123 start_codon:yes stop_codon:yes gene_type:complete